MAMNKFMHPRNPYKKPPDFVQLTLEYPDLRKYVKPDLTGKVKINFKCDGAVRELTKCLLHKDFGLTLDLPPNRLVPTLPLRMNYLLWIEDLLNETGRRFSGVDIGTGASCIYPLLAAKYFNWKMLATEIDEESVRYALKNVNDNNLSDFIKVVPVKENTLLINAIEENTTYDFCMCNPPFYSDESEVGRARTDRRATPKNHPSGQHFELIAPGGETAFISRIIEDSAKLQTRITVYTVMLGHKSNLNKVKELVKKVSPVKYKTTEFCQGRTTRWGLAWTFCQDDHLISSAIQPKKEQSKLPFQWVYPHKTEFDSLWERTRELLRELRLSIDDIDSEEGSRALCFKTFENTWSHSRRKRREEMRKCVDKQAVSPSDSVSTLNDSTESNNPTSPVSSLGYISNNEEDPIEKSNKHLVDGGAENQKKVDNPTISNVDSNVNLPSTIDKNDSASINDLSFKSKFNSSEVELSISENNKESNKRKLEETSGSSIEKKVKSMARPLLEAVLVLSEFNDDLIFSLSFVDGTGRRESLNQVFQYLKNKLMNSPSKQL